MVQNIHKKFPVLLMLAIMLSACLMPVTNTDDNILLTYEKDTVGFLSGPFLVDPIADPAAPDSASGNVQQRDGFVTWNQAYPAQQIVAFAQSLIGTPYLYGASDPAQGFDCSGFITYVFNHFNLKVPRSSVEFTNRGREVAVEKAQPGDLILFTGTDPSRRVVGHMGIVITDSSSELQFIHSSSGKAKGVTISPLKGYYEGRFMKVISVREGI